LGFFHEENGWVFKGTGIMSDKAENDLKLQSSIIRVLR